WSYVPLIGPRVNGDPVRSRVETHSGRMGHTRDTVVARVPQCGDFVDVDGKLGHGRRILARRFRDVLDQFPRTANVADDDFAGVVAGIGIAKACFFGNECDGFGGADARDPEWLAGVTIQSAGNVYCQNWTP